MRERYVRNQGLEFEFISSATPKSKLNSTLKILELIS
jgi:hypothetical protein